MNQRDVTEFSKIDLFKDGKYVIRKGMFRAGSYVDELTKKDLVRLWNMIGKELKLNPEHCDVKDCPECNIKAYKKGFKDGKKSVVDWKKIYKKDLTIYLPKKNK